MYLYVSICVMNVFMYVFIVFCSMLCAYKNNGPLITYLRMK